MKGPTLRHRVEHVLFLGTSTLIRHLPERWALGFGAGIGWFVGSVLRIRRSVVLENLERAFPDTSREWRRTTMLAAYRHLGREAAALLRMHGMAPGELRSRTEILGLEHVRSALDTGKGVIVLTGHLGNWELGGSVTAAHGIPLDVVAREQSNPLFEARIASFREELGMRVIHRRGATRHVLRALREPRAVALVADQNVRSGGVFVDFFGTPASTERGPALLAERTDAAVVVAIVHRLPGPVARYRLTFEPMPADIRAAGEAGVESLTRWYVACLERGIRESPEQYFWFHRRWKTRPEGEEPDQADTVPEQPVAGRDGKRDIRPEPGEHP
jgi:Kdo2-lipid IVA lauroyltransferase/acyltransferase